MAEIAERQCVDDNELGSFQELEKNPILGLISIGFTNSITFPTTEDLAIMNAIDHLQLGCPFIGSRQLRWPFIRQSYDVGEIRTFSFCHLKG